MSRPRPQPQQRTPPPPPNMFYLTPAGYNGVALRDPNMRISSKQLEVWEVFDALAGNAQDTGGCQAIFQWLYPGRPAGPQGQPPVPASWRYDAVRNSSTRSGGNGFHAEEVFLEMITTQYGVTGDVYIKGAMINLEPCYDGRYRGHNCIDYFLDGRALPRTRNLRRFLPYDPVTPIFYFESQPAEGESASTTRRAGSVGITVELIRAKMGPTLGSPYARPSREVRVHRISGQESCVDLRRHGQKLLSWLTRARITNAQWDYSDMTKPGQQEVLNWVYSQLPARY